ncbi:MAG: arsinothricin resistance N-acetyltransferase ArsN1 family A [Solirubrobacterales bacterium]
MRLAERGDAEAIAAIFNQGIEDRVATFETRHQHAEGWEQWLSAGDELVLVAEKDGGVVAWAAAGPYADRHHYYSGVAEATMYVERDHRGRGIGVILLNALADAAARNGTYKLVGKIFTTNQASVSLVRACGFREVGVHRRHGRLDGEWHDVMVVERLLGHARMT